MMRTDFSNRRQSQKDKAAAKAKKVEINDQLPDDNISQTGSYHSPPKFAQHAMTSQPRYLLDFDVVNEFRHATRGTPSQNLSITTYESNSPIALVDKELGCMFATVNPGNGSASVFGTGRIGKAIASGLAYWLIGGLTVVGGIAAWREPRTVAIVMGGVLWILAAGVIILAHSWIRKWKV